MAQYIKTLKQNINRNITKQISHISTLLSGTFDSTKFIIHYRGK